MGRVADQVDDAFQRRLGVNPGRFEGLEFGFEVGELSGERGLLLAGDVGGDDSFHRVLGPLVAVSLDLVDASLQRGGVASGRVADRAEVFDEPLPDGGQGAGLPGGVFGLPGALDGILDFVDGQHGDGAVGGLGLSSEAHVVLVGDALGAGVHAVDEPGAAVAAVQRSREVVQVLAFSVAAPAVGVQAVLDALEGLGIDERLVRAGVFDTTEGGVPEVVAVGQEPVDVTALKLPLGLFGRGPDGEAAVGEEIGHAGEGDVGVVGVGLEGPADVVGTIRIDSDLAGFYSVDDVADVEVADWCSAGGAAASYLLLQALHHFLSEVLAVEVGDGGEDAVDELALGRLVDVLGDADQAGSSLSDGEVDGDVVGSAAGEAVDLVDEDDVDVVLAEVAQHLLKLGSVSGSAGFACVGELGDDHRPDGIGLGLDCRALGGK